MGGQRDTKESPLLPATYFPRFLAGIDLKSPQVGHSQSGFLPQCAPSSHRARSQSHLGAGGTGVLVFCRRVCAIVVDDHRYCPFESCQSRIVPSLLDETNNFPSRLSERLSTESVCPVSVVT